MRFSIYLILITILSHSATSSVSAQVLLQENFDAASLGDPPPGWIGIGVRAAVQPGQACSGQAFRMNLYNGSTTNILDTPDLPRQTTAGTVSVGFDMRLADIDDNSQLTGTGVVYAQLIVDNTYVRDFITAAPQSVTIDCERQTASFSTADIPLGSDFRIRFLGVWTSGDWVYVIDNIDIKVVRGDQVFLQENFDDASFGDPPSGWSREGERADVIPAQACSGNAFRMNLYDGSTSNYLETPKLSRGSASGTIYVSFDMRVADIDDNNQLSGTGAVYARLIVNGALVEDFVSLSPISYTPNCEIQLASFSTDDIPMGSEFKIRFQSIWATGDWAFVIDNVDIRLVHTPINDECSGGIILPQMPTAIPMLFSTRAATQSDPSCGFGSADDDVWFRFRATANSAIIRVTGIDGFDAVIQPYEGSSNLYCSSVPGQCVDDYALSSEEITLTGLTIGQEYTYRVFSYSSLLKHHQFTTSVSGGPEIYPCTTSLVLSGNQYTADISARDHITSTQTVLSNSIVKYNADDGATLQSQFEVMARAQFEVGLDGCNE